MTTKLTPEILRHAAEIIQMPQGDGRLSFSAEFMCGAVTYAADVAYGEEAVGADAAYFEFRCLLDVHEVSGAGRLSHETAEGGWIHAPYGDGVTEASQAHRQTFLLLLAESL